MNDALTALLDAIRREPGTALLAAGGAYFLLAVMAIWSLALTMRLAQRQKRLLRGADGASLERMLREHLDGADDVRRSLADATGRGIANEKALRHCFQQVGVVRYDAFPDVGGEQSFSLALLDADNSGLTLSGLYSRHDMRVYAKPVVEGGSPLTLSDEERKAIALARNSSATGTRRS